MSTYAKVVADSVNSAGDRLTTMEVRFHRFVLAEFNTHRVFSRNSASSRAIPVAKQLERVTERPAVPLSWPAEQSGMQGGAELDVNQRRAAEHIWKDAADSAVQTAQLLAGRGVHKSVVNRVLEPFMWHTVVVTATAWDNFFAQRCSPLAQPEIREAAEIMQQVYQDSEPALLNEEGGAEWHMPYLDWETMDEAQYDPNVLKKVSAARCARVSYLTQDGTRSIAKDLELYERLVTATPMHASPLEHVARPYRNNGHTVHIERTGQAFTALTLPRYGNLLGWHQLRFDVEADLGVHAFA